MAEASETKASPEEAEAAAAPPALDRASLGLADLARAVLDRTFKPRVGEVRRLAEAVLAGKSKKKKKPRKGTDAKVAGEKSGGKKRKLSKIPGQKPRK